MSECKHCAKSNDELYGSCRICHADLCPEHYTDKGTCGDCVDAILGEEKLKKNNICPNVECFGHSEEGQGSFLAVWIEYTKSDSYTAVTNSEGEIELGNLEKEGTIKRKTGNIDAWCKWCSVKIPEEIVKTELKHLTQQGAL